MDDLKGCCFCCSISILLISIIISFITIFTISFGFSEEDAYYEAIQITWYKNPILDISLERKNDNYKRIRLLSWENIDTFCDCTHIENDGHARKGSCSQNFINRGCNEYNSKKFASKFFGSTLYVSYYPADYLTLFDRVEIDDNLEDRKLRLCKKTEGIIYKKCGYLDIFKNPFCVKENEECPINDLTFNFDSSKNLTYLSNKKNDLINSPILNQIYASEIEDATIFDINKIITYKNYKNKIKMTKEESYFNLSYFPSSYSIYNYIKKTRFFKENKLFDANNYPDWFNHEYIYFYTFKNPGNNITYPLNRFQLFLYNRPIRITLRVFIFLFKIFYFFIICFNEKKYIENIIKKNVKIFFILNIILNLQYFVLVVFNIIFDKAKYNMSRNLYDYAIINNIKEITSRGTTNFVFDIFQMIFELLIFILYFFVIWKIRKDEKMNNENLQNIDLLMNQENNN